MGRGNQSSGRSLPCPPVSATYLCTAQKNAHSSPTILLWEEIKLKRKSFLHKQALFLGYKKFHSATEGVGCLVHPYARTPTEKKPKPCTLIMQRWCLTNQEMYPFFCHIIRSRAANSCYHLLSLNRLLLKITSQQHALLKGKPPHTHLSL